MQFSEAINSVATILAETGSPIIESNYDGVIVKKLESSNTLDENRSSNQTHVAITGVQMEIFPYLRSDKYFSEESDIQNNKLKKYFITQIPVLLSKSNINYLDESGMNFTANYPNETIRTLTSIVRSRRKTQADQIQMSLINFDTNYFINFRKCLHAGDYLIVLKRAKKFEYEFFGVKCCEDNEAILTSMNNQFYMLPTNTTVDIATMQVSNKIKFSTGYQSEFEHNRIVFGAPGTGKSYKLKNDCELLLKNTFGTYERVTFHPDYTYSHFVGTYKPVNDPNGEIRYEFVPGPFMRVYVKALKSGRGPEPQPHLLLVEEINRAKVAAVFGDVFQLLDRDHKGVSEYEIHASEDLRNHLAKELGGKPDDYDRIRIPDNMFIWATMNTADQGVFPMDTAFKRRWNFEYLGINNNDGSTRGKITLGKGPHKLEVDWNQLRKAINEKLIEDYNINEDKLMGPFFLSEEVLKVNDIDGRIANPDKFIEVFKSKVIMYLFEDAAKQYKGRLFDNCRSKKYSSICNEFDDLGIYIFGNNFLEIYEKQGV